MNTEAVLFDYDGTLVYLNIDFGAMRRHIEGLWADYGLEPLLLKELYILEMINEAKEIISNKDPTKAELFYREVHKIIEGHEVIAAQCGKIFPGVVTMLELLRQRGVRVGIITRNCDKAVKILFPHIDKLCDAYIPRDYVNRVKPHPEHLKRALEEMSASNVAQCLMVGDHIIDIQAGKRIGMKTAGVLTGKTTQQDFRKAGADLIVENVTKLPEYLFKEQGR